MGATGGRVDVMAVFDPSHGRPDLPHGGTFSANPITMRAGVAGMELLDAAAFRRLDAIGEAVRMGIDEEMRRHRVPGGTVGMGSLLKMHFTDRPVRDYRSALMTPTEAARQAAFCRALLNEGVLMAPNGLMALSTPMTDADVETIVGAVSAALRASA